MSVPTAHRRAAGAALRTRFVDGGVATASPPVLLVMLYDRLVLDLVRAEEAQRAAERETAHRALVHAQDIVTELLTSLDVEVWNGGAPLAAVYAFLLRELVRANVQQDPEVTRSCRSVVEPLRDAWRQAAVTVSGAGPTPGPLVA